jgi:hypothetical protein
LLPHEEPLLTDKQIREASIDQLEDLVQRINFVLQERGMPGLLRQQEPGHSPEEQRHAPEPSDPADPGDPSAG